MGNRTPVFRETTEYNNRILYAQIATYILNTKRKTLNTHG